MDLNSALEELQRLNIPYTVDIDYDRVKKAHEKLGTNSRDLDAALDSLGMLSTPVFKTCDCSAKEKISLKHKRNFATSSPLCVVQMNPDYIHNFSLSKRLSVDSDSDMSENCTRSLGVNSLLIGRRSRARRIRRLSLWPYPKKCSQSLGTVRFQSPDKSSPPTVSRQDSGNKSNPGSPVKSQSSLTSQGSSITRSRSLDDLDIVDCLSDYCQPPAVKNDIDNIDTVSQSISQLHVS